MSRRRVTMDVIAAALGVSQATVSLVLNKRTSIKLSDETRRKVQEKAAELGYRNRRAERRSEGNRIRKIAMVFNGATLYDPFLDAINACGECAWDAGHVLTIFDHRNCDALAALISREIQTGGYQGMIFASSMTSALPVLDVDPGPDVPAVLLNCHQAQEKYPAIVPADKLGGYRMTAHLLQQGAQRIALIQGETWMEANALRLEGYRQALINHGVIPDPRLVGMGNWSLHEAYEQTLRLLALPQRPDAVFCLSDVMAQGCCQAIRDAGLRIPQDILVAGYDNQRHASEMSPPLSSVELPYDEMGRQAVNTLLQMVQGQRPLAMRMQVEGELFVRKSTTP